MLEAQSSMKKLLPGIDSRIKFVFRIKDDVLSLSGDEIHKRYKCKMNQWIKVDDLEIVGLNNSFVKVEEVFFRRLDKGEKLLEVSVDGSRRIVVTYNYPCAVVDKDRQITCVKNTFQLEPGTNNIAMGKILQARLPNAKNDHLIGKLRYLLEAEKTSKELKSYVAAVALKSIRVIDVVGSSRPMLFRVKLSSKHRPYIQTAMGIVVHS